MAHVADSTALAYVGPWNAFVRWCGARLSERCPLPASEYTVTLYVQSVADDAKTFAPVKSCSAEIAFFQKVNRYHHLPTKSLAVCMARQAAAIRFGLAPQNRKAPFLWGQVVMFATAYGVLQQG